MTKVIKIALLTILIILVVFAALADRVSFPSCLEGLNVVLYLRLVALLGLVIAFFVALGYRRRVETSQRYRRSQEILAEAEVAIQRKQGALHQMQDKLEAQFSERQRLLNEEMEKNKADYMEQIKTLKAQNVKLKETVNALMQAVKKNKETVKK